MTSQTFAPHLADVHGILAGVRQVSAIADDLAGTPQLRPMPMARDLLGAHAAFRKAYAEATVEGIRDEADARDLLRDAVNVMLPMAHRYAVEGGTDRVLIDRAADAAREFKPAYGRSYGLSLGDRVEVVFRGATTVRGEVVGLSSMDNNRATVRDETDGREVSTTCEHCDQLPTFRQRVVPTQPAPR
jgi:hypothetical protein